MKLIVACATDDGHTFSAGHFGSARNYAIYEMDDTRCTHLRSLSNTVNTAKKEHADHQKAKSMTTLLADTQVQVVVAKQFGPNIGRIKQSVVPVIVKTDSLQAGCAKLLEHRAEIIDELHKGKTRGFLMLA